MKIAGHYCLVCKIPRLNETEKLETDKHLYALAIFSDCPECNPEKYAEIEAKVYELSR